MSDEMKSDQHIAAKKAMLDLIKTTNVMNNGEDVISGMVEALQESHRTLQQSVVRAFAGTMNEYSEFKTDDRNFMSVGFAKEIKEMEFYFPFI